jgi:hypothetical protein
MARQVFHVENLATAEPNQATKRTQNAGTSHVGHIERLGREMGGSCSFPSSPRRHYPQGALKNASLAGMKPTISGGRWFVAIDTTRILSSPGPGARWRIIRGGWQRV